MHFRSAMAFVPAACGVLAICSVGRPGGSRTTSTEQLSRQLFGHMSNLIFAVVTIGNVHLAVMLGALAVVSLQVRVRPAVRGWLSVAQLVTRLAASRPAPPASESDVVQITPGFASTRKLRWPELASASAPGICAQD